MGNHLDRISGHNPKTTINSNDQPFQSLSLKRKSVHPSLPPRMRIKAISECHRCCFILLALVFLFVLPTHLFAALSVALQRDANNPAPVGYRLFQREAGQNFDYAQWIYQGPEVTSTVDNLSEGATYYFVVRAFVGADQSGDSNEMRFLATSTDLPPLADAGPQQSVASTAPVTLDGSGCSDPENGNLTYRWEQKAGPLVNLSDPHAQRPGFAAPQVSEGSIVLRFELTVTNEKNLSASDTCLVQVSANETEPTDTDGNGTPDSKGSDDDGDGMPDAWELQYGFNPLAGADAALDADSDGMTNLQEYQNGTDPMVADANLPPAQPSFTYPKMGDNTVGLSPTLRSTQFNDPDENDTHSKSQWRIQTAGNQQVLFDRTSDSVQLSQIAVPLQILNPSTSYTATVRYYDNHHLASEWSLPVTFTTQADGNDQNGDGIPDDQEVDEETDLNKDNIPDRSQKGEMKRVRSYNHRHIMGVSIESSDTVTSIDAAAGVDPNSLESTPHSEEEMPYGVVAYKIHVAEPGQTARVKIFLSDPIDSQTPWVRYDNATGLENCSAQVQVDALGESVEREVVDGGIGDIDGVANGIIVDMAGPQVVADGDSLSLSDDNASSSADSSSCFIQTLF
jgi:chitinase